MRRGRNAPPEFKRVRQVIFLPNEQHDVAESLPDDVAKNAAELIWVFGGSKRALAWLAWALPLQDNDLKRRGVTLTEDERQQRDLHRASVIRWITEYRQHLSLFGRLFEL